MSTATTAPVWTKVRPKHGALARLFDWKPFLAFGCPRSGC